MPLQDNFFILGNVKDTFISVGGMTNDIYKVNITNNVTK